MMILNDIAAYIQAQSASKRLDMELLHAAILNLLPNVELWFLDGKDKSGKVIANPNIGYGRLLMEYKDGTKREFYRVGMSANTTGISLHFMGMVDKSYLKKTYSSNIGKASITGYCIKFKSLKEVNCDVVLSAIQYGLNLP